MNTFVTESIHTAPDTADHHKRRVSPDWQSTTKTEKRSATAQLRVVGVEAGAL